MKQINLFLGVVAIVCVLAGTVFAQPITKPHEFFPGNPANAEDVNENFDTVYNQVNKISAEINIDSTNQRVGIGTTTPVATLDINGYLRLSENTSPPATCDTTQQGAIALTSLFTTCVCNGENWVLTSNGTTECTWSPLPPLPLDMLDMIILLDRSGSMGLKWDQLASGLPSFFTDANSAGVSVGINYFPYSNTTIYACNEDNYNPLHVPLVEIPANADILTTSIQSQVADGGLTPIYSALLGTYMFATDHKDNNPTRAVVVVLVTDGNESGCGVTDDSEIVALASSAYNYNGVKTYTVALSGSTVTFLNSISAAGGTSQAYNITSNTGLFVQKILEIQADAVIQ